ncbi:division/cell wall cluster transcriptional repressor MraZ [Cohaesibacter celericrescens]|jgi:MraZ protein|uniref:Transcriptional regulator MraZ n=1 Tax=Cohaesibacter celericrescens TaxID=2067669 RepID=A0A2N5XWS5_9HYPH|nr:division/cell wall cluster transcriptional repressor MraZ [Cohaesibacter celericrescens]PLW75553.1 division/cell wall cluster transcriptional repressor MraZ [Cohaesibacter celericrescens]PLW78960.1 division/cell wall cluster transcriptional repressor MraZ [Cohaesibacter celericrescens]
MGDFVSKYVNRLDSKGRVSIPAPFRQILTREGQEMLFCSPSLDLEAVDAGGLRLRGEIDTHLESFEAFSDEREVLATALLGESETLKIDKDGRVVLSDTIKAHTDITDSVVFVGQGFKFQIWQPDRYEAYKAEATERARAMRKAKAAQKQREGVGQ